MDLNTPTDTRDRKAMMEAELLRAAIKELREHFRNVTDATPDDVHKKFEEIVEAKRKEHKEKA